MSSMNSSSNFPPPTAPPSTSRTPRRKRGSLIVLSGLIFGFFPLIIPLVASIFMDDALSEGSSTLGVLPWLTFYTLPIGCVIVLVGLVIGARNLFKRFRNS